eukprot:SAG31_NODE_978_length_10615_cov_4.488208_5_plen_207_part_00
MVQRHRAKVFEADDVRKGHLDTFAAHALLHSTEVFMVGNLHHRFERNVLACNKVHSWMYRGVILSRCRAERERCCTCAPRDVVDDGRPELHPHQQVVDDPFVASLAVVRIDLPQQDEPKESGSQDQKKSCQAICYAGVCVVHFGDLQCSVHADVEPLLGGVDRLFPTDPNPMLSRASNGRHSRGGSGPHWSNWSRCCRSPGTDPQT